MMESINWPEDANASLVLAVFVGFCLMIGVGGTLWVKIRDRNGSGTLEEVAIKMLADAISKQAHAVEENNALMKENNTEVKETKHSVSRMENALAQLAGDTRNLAQVLSILHHRDR